MTLTDKASISPHKSGFVAIVGRPNVGKSTLLNTLVGQKVAITANRPQTTRDRILAVLTEPGRQLIFIDTPGIHKAKNRLGEYMVDVASRSLRDVDLILWLVEPSEQIGAGERHIIGIGRIVSGNYEILVLVQK